MKCEMATNEEEFNIFWARIIDTCDKYRRGEGIVPSESECVLEGLEVIDFSSQYGSESSVLSYVAANLAGKPCIFPSYGDYTQACVFRTYGPWWQIAPSGVAKYRGTPSDFTSADYIEVLFNKCIYPEKIEIYETYNPGAVVRILACDQAWGTDIDEGRIQWATLWSGTPEPQNQKPNIFSPPLRKINFTTNLIRIELNHQYLDYYTELDGIKIHGRSSVPTEPVSEVDVKYKTSDDHLDLVDGLRDVALIDIEDGLRDSFFFILPKEIIHLILTYLNTSDLCRLAQTCSTLRDHCYDPLLYTELNLQPYWTQVLSSTLPAISSRCSRVQRLNLSWCGKGGHIYSQVLEEFLKKHDSSLRSIELASCSFMDSKVLNAVVQTCNNIQELNLASCMKIDNFTIFQVVALLHLRKLNLYRTKIDPQSMVCIIRSSEHLEYLNIGSCQLLNLSINYVLMELGAHSKKLKGLDMWRLKDISPEGLSFLYNSCSLLEELDVGWCGHLVSESKCFLNLAQNCRKLKKLFLTANRSVRNRDLKALADFCPDLEQLDILGTREVNKSAITHLLESCKNMKMLDVSFCVGIIFADVWALRATYPHVSIKKSFQNISAQ